MKAGLMVVAGRMDQLAAATAHASVADQAPRPPFHVTLQEERTIPILVYQQSEHTIAATCSGCLILTFMEPISSYSRGNRHYLQGPSRVASSGLSLRFLSGIIKGSQFCGAHHFRSPLQN